VNDTFVGIAQSASSKSASHLLKHPSEICRVPMSSASDDRAVAKSHGETTQQHAFSGGTSSQLQMQLDFVAHLMRIGQRLSHLPTKELRGE